MHVCMWYELHVYIDVCNHVSVMHEFVCCRSRVCMYTYICFGMFLFILAYIRVLQVACVHVCTDVRHVDMHKFVCLVPYI